MSIEHKNYGSEGIHIPTQKSSRIEQRLETMRNTLGNYLRGTGSIIDIGGTQAPFKMRKHDYRLDKGLLDDRDHLAQDFV